MDSQCRQALREQDASMSFRLSTQSLVGALVLSALSQASMAQQQLTSAVAVGRPDFAWVDLSACPIPKLKPPAVPREDYEEYNLKRRFLAFEPGRPCIVMDSFIERLGGSSSPGMRTLGARKYRLERGKWVDLRMAFLYFPYAIRRQQDNRVFYVEAPLWEDVWDNMAVGSWSPSVYTLEDSVTAGQTRTDATAIGYLTEPQGAVLQGLAVILHQRLKAGLIKTASQDDVELERKRIRLLLQTAWEHLPPPERVPVNADGLPR
jgi:hypothetical protein